MRPRPVAMAILTPAFCTAQTASAFSFGTRSQLPGRRVPSISNKKELIFHRTDLVSFCSVFSLYQSLTLSRKGIFALGVMFVQLDFSRSRPRRWRRLLPLALTALLLALPRLAALVPAAVALADRAIGAHYTARLDTLQQEKFCPAPASCRISRCSCREPRPAPAGKQRADSLRGCSGAGHNAAGRRLHAGMPGCGHRAERAGRRRAVRGQRDRRGGRLLHRHLCRHRRAVRCVCRAGHAGAVGADRPARRLCAGGRGHRDHPGGDWLGTLTGTPATGADGLTARTTPTDTANLWDTVYFVKKVIAFFVGFRYNSL